MSAIPAVTPAEVLDFWFGPPPTSLDELQRVLGRHSPPLDEPLRERFGDVVEAALDGAYEEWTQTPQGMLALILLVDQFPRHIYRGTARQYDGDARALQLALRAHEAGWGAGLSFVEATYMFMPFAHAEDLEIQRLNVEVADRISASAPPWVDFFAEIGPAQSRKYKDVIERFGRFPHRNEMLGRASTPEEVTFLQTWSQPPEVLVERGLIPRPTPAHPKNS